MIAQNSAFQAALGDKRPADEEAIETLHIGVLERPEQRDKRPADEEAIETWQSPESLPLVLRQVTRGPLMKKRLRHDVVRVHDHLTVIVRDKRPADEEAIETHH